MSKHESGKPHKSFGAVDFLFRLIAALILVFATYNPSGYSYFHWIKAVIGADGTGAIHYFVGVLLLVGWTIYLVATLRSLGTLGSILSLALVGTGIWVLADIGIIHADSANTIAWLSLIALAILLAIGLSWAHIWRRLSGQLEVDDSED